MHGSYCRWIDDAVDLTNLSQPERMQHVLRLLETRDYVQVAELSQAFAVSEVTVRSDLGQLARQGLVARIRGGARALQHGQSEVGFDLRMRLEVDAKRAIARAAAEMVNEGEAVALDASTTAYYLALELCSKRELVVVTNGLLVATALADAPGITVLLTGASCACLRCRSSATWAPTSSGRRASTRASSVRAGSAFRADSWT